jgi:phenylpropionate dioxygenase-like ring-hydroxylating dioxygenase large terminal subunit
VRLYTAESGQLGARFLRCPYHAWSYRLDGALASYPLRAGYEGTGMCESANGQGLAPVSGLKVYRGFIFVRVNPDGPSFEDYFGEAVAALDQMVDRSPSGELVIEGGVLRNTIHCNWKFYLENINDTVHPVSTHESAVRAAQSQWTETDPNAPKPLAIEQILPFGQPYAFFEGMGGRVLPHGHSISGTRASVHSGYGELGDYVKALAAAHGEERAKAILEHSPQNVVLYPSLAVKGSPQTIRVIRPVAVDRTVIEAWNFRTVGGPDLLFDRALNYSRLVFSPMSIVAHDDIHLFEQQQQGLRSGPNDWVSLHRDFNAAELDTLPMDTNGSSELLIRNQYRAWAAHMTRRIA